MRLSIRIIAGCVMLPSLAVAQEKGTGARADRTAVFMQAGYASGLTDMGGAALGGLLVQDLSSRLSLEAAASYFGHGMGASGLTASAALLVHLRPTGEKAVPYLVAGGGLYRASFDMGNGRYSGPMNMGGSMMSGSGMMGSGSGWDGSAWTYGQMPHFYGRRIANGTDPTASRYGGRSFTDPAISLGAGIRIDLGSRLDLRPDARALLVVSGGDTSTVGVFSVSFGYRF